jgi:hypothetical protein
MHDLNHFTSDDAEACAAAFRKAATDSTTMENAATEVVRYLYENLVDSASKRKACALVRLYKTHTYGELTPELQRFADGVLGHKLQSTQTKCLTLLATVGEKPEWNSRQHSRAHQAIPLPTADFVSKIPMIARLINQFGLDINAVIRPDPNLLADLERRTYNAFHVPEVHPGSERLRAGLQGAVGIGFRWNTWPGRLIRRDSILASPDRTEDVGVVHGGST